MSKNTLTEYCIAVKGYDSDKVSNIAYGDEVSDKNAAIQILNIDKVSYPIDMDCISRIFNTTTCAYVIITDGNLTHIFERGSGAPSEVSDIRSNVPADLSSVKEADAKYVLDMLRGLLNKHPDMSAAYKELLAIAIELARMGIWDDFKYCNNPYGYIQQAESRINAAYPGLITGAHRQIGFTEELKILELYSNISTLGDNSCIADAYEKVFCRREFIFAGKELIRSLIPMSQGRTAVITPDQCRFVVESGKAGFKPEMYGRDQLNQLNMFRHICKSELECVDSWFIDGESYDTIIALPPIAYRMEVCEDEESIFFNRRPELLELVLENAINRLKDGGRIITVVNNGFLFSHKNQMMRDWILTKGSVRFIATLDRPFENTSVDCTVLVFEKKLGLDGTVIAGSLKRNEFQQLQNLCYNNVCGRDCVKISADLLRGSDWTPARFAISDRNVAEDAISLEEVAEVLSGIQVRSSEYLDGSSIGGIPYLRVSNVQESRIVLENCKRIPAVSAKMICQSGDIVMSIAGTIGKLALVQNETFVPSSQIAVIRCRSGYSAEKLFKALMSDDVSIQIASGIIGAAIKHISVRTLKSIMVSEKEVKE